MLSEGRRIVLKYPKVDCELAMRNRCRRCRGHRLEVKVSAVYHAPEGVSSAMGLEAPRATRVKKGSIIGGYIEIDEDRSRAVDEEDPPGTIEGVIPDRGSDGQGSREKVEPVDVGGD